MVFGGSFDPPHSVHLSYPWLARLRMLGEKGQLLYVPAARSPHKSSGPIASDADRLAMLRAMTDGLPDVAIWTDEIDRAAAAPARPSYTVDTLRRLRTFLPADADVRLLIGADQALAFHRWRTPRAILRLATPAVMLREPAPEPWILYHALQATGYWSRSELAQWASWIVPVPPVEMSSTATREALAHPPRKASAWSTTPGLKDIPREVRRYILEHGLYRA